MAPLKALVLAGDRGPMDDVARAAGVPTKAFAEIAGKPMIEHVIAALRGVDEIGEIAVSIAPGAPALPAGLRRIDAGPTPATSAAEGLAALGAPLLITTADHPLLTPEMVRDFIAGARASGADAAAAASVKEVVEKAGNPARRTWLRFSDGWLSGANLFLVETREGVGAIDFWKSIEADRKHPLKMAKKIGLLGPLLYLCGRLSRARVAKMIGRLAGCKAAIVLLDHPNAAHDVDKRADLDFAEKRLSGR
ncbi:MAG: NTP transferase domain-containing protein [Paracoccaceae bacterium]